MSLQRLQELMDQSAAVAAATSGTTASAAAAAVAASTEHARAVLHTNAVRQAGSPAWDQPPPPPPPRRSTQNAALVLPLLTAAPLVREGEVTGSMSWDTWTPTISSNGVHGQHFHSAHGSSGGAKHAGGNPKHHYNIAYKFAGPVERKVQQMLEVRAWVCVQRGQEYSAQLIAVTECVMWESLCSQQIAAGTCRWSWP